MYSHILFPTDGSDNAAEALKNVRALAQAYGAKVTVLHALQIPYPSTAPALGMDFTESLQQMTEILTENAKTTLEETVRQLRDAGLEVDSIMTRIDPREAIREALQERDFDLIVMGSRGLNALERAIIGSVSSYVLNHLHGVPLLVVPA